MRLRFIDRLLSLTPCHQASAIKCVSFEESMLIRPWSARGVPRTLLIEWLGQLSAVLVAESTQFEYLAVLGSFTKATWGETLLAGDRATLEIRVRSWKEDSAFLDGSITLETGKTALQLEKITIAFVPLETLWEKDELKAAIKAARGEFPGPVGFR